MYVCFCVRAYVRENVDSFSYVTEKFNVTYDTTYVTYVTSYVQLMLLRQVFLRTKFFAFKKHDVRVRKQKKEKNIILYSVCLQKLFISGNCIKMLAYLRILGLSI